MQILVGPFKGKQSKSVELAVWPPAVGKVTKTRLPCSLVDNLLVIVYFVDRLKGEVQITNFQSKSKTQRNLNFYERQ